MRLAWWASLVALVGACSDPAPSPSADLGAADAFVCPDALPASDETCADNGAWCGYPITPRGARWCLCNQFADARRLKWGCFDESCPGAESAPPAASRLPSGTCTPGDQCEIVTYTDDIWCTCAAPDAVWKCSR